MLYEKILPPRNHTIPVHFALFWRFLACSTRVFLEVDVNVHLNWTLTSNGLLSDACTRLRQKHPGLKAPATTEPDATMKGSGVLPCADMRRTKNEEYGRDKEILAKSSMLRQPCFAQSTQNHLNSRRYVPSHFGIQISTARMVAFEGSGSISKVIFRGQTCMQH